MAKTLYAAFRKYGIKNLGFALAGKLEKYYFKIKSKKEIDKIRHYSFIKRKSESLQRVVYVTESANESSLLFRVRNICEYLNTNKIITHILTPYNIFNKETLIDQADVIVFQRLEHNEYYEALLERLKGTMPLVYEADDLLFEPSENTGCRDKFTGYRKMLNRCDYFLTTTGYLARRAELLGKKSFIIRNGLNGKLVNLMYKNLNTRNERLPRAKALVPQGLPSVAMTSLKVAPTENQGSRNGLQPALNLSMCLRKKYQKASKGITLGFFSGTPTHDSDFAILEESLFQLFSRFPGLNLLVVGFLNLPDKFSRSFGKRIKQVGVTGLEKMLGYMFSCDINIVPFRRGLPFNEAKSELKYVFAGLMSVPTVASPTEAYSKAIENGKNGFLAADEKNWVEILSRLIMDKDLRKNLGRMANENVLAEYSPDKMAHKTNSVFMEIIKDYSGSK